MTTEDMEYDSSRGIGEKKIGCSKSKIYQIKNVISCKVMEL